ncbi:DUF6461 domain-containing protein [Spirillospora sp. NPDC049652]
MADGLEWIADGWSGARSPTCTDFSITCARGIDPEELVGRVADRASLDMLAALTADEASRMVDMARVYSVGRFGRSGQWSFLVESGCAEGWFLPVAVSTGGAEVLVFDSQQDHPPPRFSYYKDGAALVTCSLIDGDEMGGAQPALLLEAMHQTGLDPEAMEEEDIAPTERLRRMLRMIGEHFDLALPEGEITQGALPGAVIRTSPPSHW